ncbi:phosphate signaling complex protein PhoU [Litorilinea aerophila]|uniref:Phosphate-specific transport system accessory protein PhoU n=1 Tax=Litorilinea aerophila TaxID=1204385 RepID=A0A540VGG4_9CHLR|nr:phosphate signaling complex protein PhoU [Litorilinea aerophila]MCC9076547.1 phosphate signaling complex protein PhoU [Litorilinea aerophila]
MTRERFDAMLASVRDEILLMGSQVAEELQLALRALEGLDGELAQQAIAVDREINRRRFAIEDECFLLIATQQPTARDLRLIFAAMNMIVDLERMGDQAKGVAKLVPQLAQRPHQHRPPELHQMGPMVARMLEEALQAYAENDMELARKVIADDDQVDARYANVFTQVMYQMAQAGNPEQVEAAYELLRAARELERFGDLCTNIAERTLYLATGSMENLHAATAGSPEPR